MFWGLLVNHFIKVIMNNFSEIHNVSFVDLILPVLLYLQPTVVELSKISDVKLAVLPDERKLGVVHFFLVGNSELVRVIFTNFKKHLPSFHLYSLVNEILGVSSLNLKNERRARMRVSDFNAIVLCLVGLTVDNA